MNKELIKELINNHNKTGVETVRIDYIIERLKENDKKLIKEIERRSQDLHNRINEDTEEEFVQEYSMRALELLWLRDDLLKDGQHEDNN